MNRARSLFFASLLAACGGAEDATSTPAGPESEEPSQRGEAADTPAPDEEGEPAHGECVAQPCVSAPADPAVTYGYEIVEQGTDLYWTSWGPPQSPPDGRVFAVRKDGSSPPRVLAQGLDFPMGLASDGDHVYVAVANEGKVLRCSDSACEEQPFLSRAGRPYAIALDATDVYVAYFNQQGSSDGEIVRCAKSGCADGTVIAASRANPESIAVTGTTVVWTEVQGYTVTSGKNAIYACPKAGCDGAGPTEVASALDGAARVRVGPNGVYWLTRGSLATAQATASTSTGAGIMVADADGKNARIAHAWNGFLDDAAQSPDGFFVADPARVASIKTSEEGSKELPYDEPARALTIDSTFLYMLGSTGSVRRLRLPQ